MFERFFAAKVAEREDRRLAKQLVEVTDRLEAMERTVKNLKLEWEESYDKLHHLMARVTKRSKTLEREQNEESSTAPEARRNDFPNGKGERPILGTHGTLQEMRQRHGLLPR